LSRAHHARRLNLNASPVFPQGGSPTNLALNKPATQSSTYQGAGGALPGLAVDGNTSGNWWPDFSVSSTYADPQAWWQVDLGSTSSIQSVEVWNRTDCCGDRLTNFNVLLLDNNQNVVSMVNFPGQAGTPSTISIAGAARYVKLQLVGTNYLSLAEVKVWGTPGVSTPFGGTAIPIPGTIEVENYDEGGPGVAYHDTTGGSQGQDYDNAPNYPVPSFRYPTDVDIYKSAGYNNGYLVLSQAGDWMKYTVNVAQSGAYVLQAKTWYWNTPGGNFHIESDGVDITGAIQVPGGGGDWNDINRTVSLTAGQHVLRLVCDTNGADGYTGDIDDIKFIGTADQFVNTTHQSSLARSPQTDEANYWADINRSAYAHGALALTMDEMGRTLFESATYAGRNRNDHWYVYDLYKTYLMREPDPGGWAFWESYVPSIGRASVRRAFAGSAEFGRLVSVLTASGSPSAGVSSLATAQVDLFNQTGNQVRARDCEWGLPLISLPGRAGLDLGLSLSYSSMVWTRSGPYTYFDEDYGNPSPGFHLGFPTIRGPYFDAALGKSVFLLITSSGRIQLRQIGTSNIYESFDSSYLQLTLGANSTLRTADGMRMSYSTFEDELHCTGIEDRNGNLITVTYNLGDIRYVTDTLNRTFEFKYDSNSNLTSIEQSWAGQSQPHQWVTFGWTPSVSMSPAVSGVIGTYTNEQPPMLKSVSLHDGSNYKFEYTGDGQVREIRRYATQSDTTAGLTLTYIYNAAADDCPRLNAARVSAANWTGINGLGSYVETQFGLEGSIHKITSPDGTIYKETYGTGWQRGLVTHTEIWGKKDPNSPIAVQRQTDTQWVRDNSNDDYPTNARPTMQDVYDNDNHSRAVIGYQTFTLPVTNTNCSLPNDVYEYAADLTTVLRRTHTDYNPDSAYLNARIIGLPSAKLLYQGVSTLISKTTFAYDWGGDYIQGLPAPPTQHDGGYSTDLFVGRGNLVSVKRWDVNHPDDVTKATENKLGYDINGSLTFSIDASQHYSSLHYGDWFSDNTDHHTFAYVTTATDADGNNSSVQYNFDLGLKSQTVGPPPQGQQSGIVQIFTYDNAARPLRVMTSNNGAYTRYIYGGDYVASYATVNNVADEAYSIRYFDGAGHDLSAVTLRPEGGFNVQLFYRDAMGRVIQQSNPTQTDYSGSPTGDDGAGYQFNVANTFDWKGRPLKSYNMDGTYKEASYAGCGCAGGEVVTLTDEVERQQKVYSDVTGRQWKTEALTYPDGNDHRDVYSTTVYVFNARDQVTVGLQYAGIAASDASSTNEAASCPSGTCQKTTMSYDGYGRLASKHVPQQQVDPNNSASTDHTTWDYNSDDTINFVKDARGAKATYEYSNNRHLVSHVTYDPAIGGADTPDVWFGYDAVGNRASMTDGLGSESYSYNSLSQLISETRSFTNVGSFTLSYDYNFAGELKKITDSTNMTINYHYDNAGRLSDEPATGTTAVTGSGNLYAGVANYASNFQYRAWGGLKTMTDGKGYTSAITYNSRLQPNHFEISGGLVSQNYDYFNDGRISFVHNLTDANFDRSYSYDHITRLTEAKSGGQARNSFGDTPYSESFVYDAFSNLAARQSDSWNGQTSLSDSTSYTNNRRSGWGYDADGRNTTLGSRSNAFDAAGRQIQMTTQQVLSNGNHITVSQGNSYDGDGRNVVETASSATTYHLRSSALGGEIVEELNSSGQKTTGYVSLPGGQLLATQTLNPATVTWKHNTPAGTSEYTVNTYNATTSRTEFDPLSADISLTQPPDPQPTEGAGEVNAGHFGGITDQHWTDFFNLDSGFVINGHSVGSSEAASYLNFGTGGRSIDNLGMTGESFANALLNSLGPAIFAPVGSSTISINVSGVEGIPGRQAIEWQWVKYDSAATFAPVPTAYSGTTSIPGSVVTMAASIPQRESSISKQIKSDVGAARAKLQGDQRCRDFLNNLLALARPDVPFYQEGQMTASGVVTNTIFDALDEIHGASFEETGKSGVKVDGSLETINDLRTPAGSRHVFVNDSYITQKPEERMFAVIHESLHMFSGFTDQALAVAAQRAAGVKEKDIKHFPGGPAGTPNASLKLNEYIQRYCAGLQVGNGTTFRLGE
jgi:hypothetical protein